jgi:Icc protein
MSTKIIQITDLHLNKSKDVVSNGVNTLESANMVIDSIRINEKDIDCLVLSGDLSNDCSIESYNHLMQLLKDFETSIYLMAGNHDSPSHLKTLANNKNIFLKNFQCFNNWGVFMFNTKKENSPNGLLKKDELKYFDEVLSNTLYENIIIFLHHHPVPIGSASMDSMIIENAELLTDRIMKYDKIKAVSWGHIHNEFDLNMGSAKLFSTPSTCYQAKEKSKNFIIDPEASPGYRKIYLNDDGSFNTEVIRVS